MVIVMVMVMVIVMVMTVVTLTDLLMEEKKALRYPDYLSTLSSAAMVQKTSCCGWYLCYLQEYSMTSVVLFQHPFACN